MNDIGDWDNSMAQGMISLEEEREAFGETTPRNGGNNHGFEDWQGLFVNGIVWFNIYNSLVIDEWWVLQPCKKHAT